jgi:hypothetical protein
MGFDDISRQFKDKRPDYIKREEPAKTDQKPDTKPLPLSQLPNPTSSNCSICRNAGPSDV